jgi:hypothetical protein
LPPGFEPELGGEGLRVVGPGHDAQVVHSILPGCGTHLFHDEAFAQLFRTLVFQGRSGEGAILRGDGDECEGLGGVVVDEEASIGGRDADATVLQLQVEEFATTQGGRVIGVDHLHGQAPAVVLHAEEELRPDRWRLSDPLVRTDDAFVEPIIGTDDHLADRYGCWREAYVHTLGKSAERQCPRGIPDKREPHTVQRTYGDPEEAIGVRDRALGAAGAGHGAVGQGRSARGVHHPPGEEGLGVERSG